VATRSSSSKAAPHDEQEPSEDLPGIRVPKVNLIKSPKWPIKSPLKGVHRHHPRAFSPTRERYRGLFKCGVLGFVPVTGVFGHVTVHELDSQEDTFNLILSPKDPIPNTLGVFTTVRVNF
jgi:hypothetical protein